MAPSNKRIFKTIDYKNILDIKSYPSSIIFSVLPFKYKNNDNVIEKDELRFNTYQSYEVK